ncbi:MAG: molybdopterin-dependent oxidoreductase, partial [Candidatus Poseidoniaceae archaeon]|nr:molybdopterin-dependent oxidoreductase [Candidatus Poseidoniaceae archaeon]
MAKSFIERIAQSLRIIPNLDKLTPEPLQLPLRKFPESEHWHDHMELDAQAWPKRVERNYSLVPTTCFNCESACGLMAYVDKDSGEIQKFEGNPHHPGSRGRNCAKGPATINQIKDTERIMHPLRRKGERGSGEWEKITWDEALDEISSKIRSSLK